MNHHTPVSTAVHAALRQPEFPSIPINKVKDFTANNARDMLIRARKIMQHDATGAAVQIDSVIASLGLMATGGEQLTSAEPVSDLSSNFDMAQFSRQVRKATLPSHTVETQEEADQINEWIALVTGMSEVHFRVGDQFHLLPMHAG
jgi:hypothetical protein